MIFLFKSTQIFACGLQRNRKTLPCLYSLFFLPDVKNKVESLLAQRRDLEMNFFNYVVT